MTQAVQANSAQVAGEPRAVRAAVAQTAVAQSTQADPVATGAFLGAFFDELMRGGVRAAVVSPGSRSTPLAMVAYEAQRRFPEFRLVVDVDERGAAFMALGMAKASGRPVCLICTSGTAVANYYPAVMEAAVSRVPLLVLTGDRPPRLQGLGAPQTCDQIKAFGSHVALFRQMPLPGGSAAEIAFARQAAREALMAAGGVSCAGGAVSGGCDAAAGAGEATGALLADLVGGQAADGAPVHLNFPFDEPLKPDTSAADLFEAGRSSVAGVPPVVRADGAISADQAVFAARLLASRRAVVVAGEGSVRTAADAAELLAWAREGSLPVLADPLSGLRSFDDELVIDNYDNIFGRSEFPQPEAIIRFGRWPVSKRCTVQLEQARPLQIVVDPRETRDFNAATDVLMACSPQAFVQAMRQLRASDAAVGAEGMLSEPDAAQPQREFAQAWVRANDEERARICAADQDAAASSVTGCIIDADAGAGEAAERDAGSAYGEVAACVGERSSDAAGIAEGPFVRRLLACAPEGSCLWAASSMSVRAVDTFCTKGKHLRLLCNRGLNGIDGTLSSAVGAALELGQATLLTGDLALLHDANAFALQRELLVHQAKEGEPAPSLTVVLLNNNGGAIFDMLPQQSEDPYFERLFLTPQDVRFQHAAEAFGVPYRAAETPDELEAAYVELAGTPGISLIEVCVPLSGLKERYARYW